MVVMDAAAYYSSSDRLMEMWRKIDHLHLSYLEMEESPEKIEHRMKLEDCIRDYLCIASHSQKFCFPETAEVLYRSASNKKDFSGYKASTGWNAIQLYAGNLLSQPWRKEYRQIKTYCGFYKHQIEANLVGAEIMFEAMGYKHFGNGVLVLDGPICPDRVTSVSKDCLIAYVECQILKAIWEEVSQSFNVTWMEVLDFRKSHLCGPEQSIKALNYQHHQKQYQQEHTRSYSQGSDPFGGGGGGGGSSGNSRPLPNVQSLSSPMLHHGAHSFPPPGGSGGGHHHGYSSAHVVVPPPPPPPVQYIYGTVVAPTSNGCCANNYHNTYHPTYAHGYATCPGVTLPCHVPPPPMMKTSPYSNGYYCAAANGFAPAVNAQPYPLYGYTVPTGQLVEVESHAHNGNYDVIDNGPPSRRRSPPPPLQVSTNNRKVVEINKTPQQINRDLDQQRDESQQFEDWDYVYRNLEIQGYSKDLGERGDLLSPAAVAAAAAAEKRKKTRPTNLDDAMNNLSLAASRPLKISEALEKLDKDGRKGPVQSTVLEPALPGPSGTTRRLSQSSSYENLSMVEPAKKTVTASTSVKGKTKTLPAKDKTPQKPEPSSTSASHRPTTQSDAINKKPAAPATIASSNSTVKETHHQWECRTCTYLNQGANDICEMCSKSRTNVEQQMEIGGAECSKCTLVNPKELVVCQACGASLKNSPTYI